MNIKTTLTPAQPTVAVTVTFTAADILALAGKDDWMWENVLATSAKLPSLRPSQIDALYWALRDAYHNHLADGTATTDAVCDCCGLVLTNGNH